MAKYHVMIPATAAIWFDVEADTEEEAIEAAFNSDFSIDFRGDNCELAEIELHHHVTRGNVCSAVLNSIDVTLVSDGEDE